MELLVPVVASTLETQWLLMELLMDTAIVLSFRSSIWWYDLANSTRKIDAEHLFEEI